METLKISVSEDTFTLSSFKQMIKYANASEDEVRRFGGIYMTRNQSITQSTEKEKTVFYSVDGKSVRIWDIDGFDIEEGFMEGRFIPANILRALKDINPIKAEYPDERAFIDPKDKEDANGKMYLERPIDIFRVLPKNDKKTGLEVGEQIAVVSRADDKGSMRINLWRGGSAFNFHLYEKAFGDIMSARLFHNGKIDNPITVMVDKTIKGIIMPEIVE